MYIYIHCLQTAVIQGGSSSVPILIINYKSCNNAKPCGHIPEHVVFVSSPGCFHGYIIASLKGKIGKVHPRTGGEDPEAE